MKTGEARVTRVLTMKELQSASGAPSTTIHYYLRHGLLPRPHKTSRSRSLYTEDHLKILLKIAELKQAGFSLMEIKSQVQDMVTEADESTVDLAGQERELMRNRILTLAATEFVSKGYMNAHVTSIVDKLRITPSLLYSHFPSKRGLLAACVTLLMDWSMKYVDSKQATTDDPARRVLWLIFGHANVFRLGSTALSLVRVEGSQNDSELHKPVVRRFDKIIEHYTQEFAQIPAKHAQSWSVPDELLGHSLFAAYEQTVFRASADEKYTRRDLMLTHLWLFLAVQAARRGEIDIDSRLAQYEELVSELSTQMPPLPPQLQS
jgi:DNA-binding transcriptional MerR regulator